jgi:hypothetical protein
LELILITHKTTKMTNLERLEADIRARLPRLMELTEGCRLIFQDKPKTIMLVDEEPEKYVLVYSENKTGGWYSAEFIKSKATVIGKDPMLNDVLDWLDIKGIYAFTSDGEMIESYEGWDTPTKSKWNLSKPLLKDQSQELIDYLVTLI